MVTPATSASPAPSRTINLELPWWPREVEPNVHVDKWFKIKARKDYGAACDEEVMVRRAELRVAGARLPIPGVVAMRVTFVLTSHRPRDYDNLIASFKHGQDALVRGGLIMGDDCWRLRPSYSVELGPKNVVRVELQGAE